MRKSFVQADKDSQPKWTPATGAGFGVPSFKPYQVPSFASTSRTTTARKRTRVVYAESGAFYHDDQNDEDHDPNAEKKAKLAAKSKKKDEDDSDDDVKKPRFGFVDKYVAPLPVRQFPVYAPRPFGTVVAATFALPGIRRKGKIVETRITNQALGTTRAVPVIPRPLHNPLEDHAIVLWDPTVDDREGEREEARLFAIEEAKKADREGQAALDEEERERAKVHRSLAQMLGLVPSGGPKKIKKVPVVIDPRVGKVLRPHQVEGVKFLYKCVTGMTDENAYGCIMADEMGLGKTLQCITLLWTLLKQSPLSGKGTIDKAIVVCPSSLVRNWANELVKWLGEGAVCPLAIDGKVTGAPLIKLVRQWCVSKGKSTVTPIIIVSYETLRSLTDELGTTEVGLLLADEGHRLKNSGNQTYTAINQINCKRRVILTGTPIQNDLTEYYSLLSFCNPGYLGTKLDFRKMYEIPIIRGRDGDASDKEKEVGDAKMQELTVKVNKFIIRRTNDLLSKYLPVKYEHVVFCALSPFQLALYNYFINSDEGKAILKGKESQPLRAITLLRKLCNHPDLLPLSDDLPGCESLFPEGYVSSGAKGGSRRNGNGPSFIPELGGKMAVLSRFLKQMMKESDDKLVLVSNFTQTLDVFETLCRGERYGFCRLDGAMTSSKRQKLVDKFNDPEGSERIFLLSSKAGGCGINLIGANRLILFDPDWNPASDMQALARVWRDGQKKDCFVYRFVATGTLEEKIFQRQAHKQNLSSCVVDGEKDIERHYSIDGLRQLFLYTDAVCQTHDLWKCKRCKPKTINQITKSPAMLYGDTSTWNHLANADLANIHDDLLRAETGLDSVTACFQYIST